MNVKSFLAVVPLVFLTACVTPPPQKCAFNPDGLNDRDLVQAQLERILKLERDMERRESDLKYQHMKELTQVQMQTKARSSECRFLCF